MKIFDVLVVGELNVDIILDNIQGFPGIGKEIISKDMNVTLGSSSAIFASNLSSLENKVGFLGKIGNDNFAQIVIDSLNKKKVNTDNIIQSAKYKTGLTVVMNYGMDRANVTFPGAMVHLEPQEISDLVLKKARHFHLSSVFLQTGLLKGISRLFKRAKDLGLTTSMDPQWDPSEKWSLNLKELLPHVDMFMPNAEEFKYLTKSEDIHSGLIKVKSFSKNIIIKEGIYGAHLWNGVKLTSRPAFLNSQAIDCIGAGDSFDAGFISEFLGGKDLEKCLDAGNLIGAINTTASGGTTAFKNLAAIKEIAKNRFSYDL